MSTGELPLVVENLSVEFATDRGWTRVVDDVSFQIGHGEIVGVVGESGSGKSVTSLAIMGLIGGRGARIASGSIRLAGRELVGMRERDLEDVRGDRVAMIFQEPMTSLNPAFTVGQQIAEGVRRHQKVSKKEAMGRAIEVLELVGIPNAAKRAQSYPHQFSGGMRQRAMIAMAVACEPAVLIADEPTTALDVTIQAQILDLLRSMRDRLGLAIMFVTHNMGVVADICDRVQVMYAGQLVESADAEALFETPKHPYAEGLLRAMPVVSARLERRLPSIPGSTPMPWQFPTGCRFEPRCPYATDECIEPVPLTDTGPGRRVRCVRADHLALKGTV